MARRAPMTIALLLCLVVIMVAAAPAVPSVTIIDVPGSVQTNASDINNAGEVVGTYTGSDGRSRGFLWSGSNDNIVTIEFADAQLTAVSGVNDRGDMVGNYAMCEVRDPGGACARMGQTHPFVLRDDVFTPIDIPVDGASATVPYDINNRGDIVGTYRVLVEHVGSFSRGFLLDRDGMFHTVAIPGNPDTWELRGINERGDLVGRLLDFDHGIAAGFLLDRKGTFTVLDVPGAVESSAEGINARGDIVGTYALPPSHLTLQGFVRRGAKVSSFTLPGAYLTHTYSINASGQVVGVFMDTAAGRAYGFVTRM